MSSAEATNSKPRVQQRMTGFATVKGVTSGDSLILLGGRTTPGQPAVTKDVTLSGIICPRVSRGRSATDEPYAWEAREYLRKKVIGKQVAFTVNYSNDSGRQFAKVMLGAEDLAESLVRAGWATVKPSKSTGRIHPEREAMMEMQAQAEGMGLGQHRKGDDPKNHVRKVNWSPDRAFFDAVKGKPLPAIVDRVRDGSTIRCEIINPATLKHTMLLLNLAGVGAPRVPIPHDFVMSQYNKRRAENPEMDEDAPVEEAWPAFAAEAQAYTEARLLNRDCHVVIQGTDKFNNMFGTILFPKGNISLKLVAAGLARKVKWSATLTPDEPQITQAEAGAKQKRLRLWKDFTGEAEEPVGIPLDFQAQVVSIVSGDSIVVKDDEGKEIKVALASIRAPRMGGRSSGEEPHAYDAREFLRTRLVGKKIRVLHEYSRSPPGREKYHYVSLLQGNLNLAEHLVMMGFATIIRHRVDEDRSRFYSKLLDAEVAAIAGGKGVHGKRNSTAKQVVDLTKEPRKRRGDDDKDKEKDGNRPEVVKSKAQGFLPFFQKSKTSGAVVEYAFSGARLKLYAPHQNCLMSFVLAGVRTPSTKPVDGKVDPLGAKALQFTRSRVLQRDVRIEVETLDRGDNFVGSLFIGGQNLGIDLLKAGLAKLYGPSAERSKYSEELFAAEKEAKDAKLGVWENFVEEVKEVTEGDEGDESVSTSAMKVKVTEITDCTTFYIQTVGDKNVETVEEKMADFSNEPPAAPEDWKPSRGEICAGLFPCDNAWYRVRNESQTAKGDFRVYFVDYGNHDQLELASLRPLPEDLKAIRPCAKACVLAGIKGPKAGSDYFEDSIQLMSELVWDKEVTAKVECQGRTDHKFHLTLWVDKEEDDTSVNRTLLQQGWGRVVGRPEYKLKGYCRELQEDEDAAKLARKNIWEYGDVSDEDDGEDERGRPGTRQGP
jgi:staphylococcal nuclease domain-containing protein 1